MIREHEFNSRWWGKSVGIVDDRDFFTLGPEETRERLQPYDWVEFKTDFGPQSSLDQIQQAGFFQVDTQLPFSINLGKLVETASTLQLEARDAVESPFELSGEQLAPFTHERFRYIPGCTPMRIDERYALWTNELVGKSPQTCLQVSLEGRTQGWFLAQPGRSGRLQLTLAMLARDATVSGMLLYHKACLVFAARGHRLGEASFSVTNTAVHNMYAMLGARFLPPVGQWLWLSDARRLAADASS